MAHSFIAGADLTGKVGYAVKADTDNKEVVLAGANEVALGILKNANTSGNAVGVATLGERVLAKLGGAVEFGNKLKVTTGGVLIVAGGTGDDNVIAEAQEDGASGDLIYVIVEKFIK